jgi:tetratricopeptide (TPR) repeat protein
MRLMLLISILSLKLFSFDIDIESLKMEAENDSTNTNIRVILAGEYIKNKNYKEAEVTLNQILAIDKNHKKANILMNQVNKNLHNSIKKSKPNIFERANNLEKIYKQSHLFDDFKSYFYELEGLGEKELGYKKLKEFVKENPQNENAVLFLANHYYWNKKTKKSLEILKPVINQTSNIELLTLHGNILQELGYTYKALKSFRKIVELGGENDDIRKKIASLQKPQTKIANKNTKQRVNKKSNNQKYLAEKLFFKNRYKKSLPHYRAYFKSNSNDNLARFHYATALEKLKLYKKAEKEYKKVADRDNKLYNLATYRYAQTLMYQKDEVKWDRARDTLENLLYTLVDTEPSKEINDILKYTEQSLKIASIPMPKAKMYQDVMLTAEQSKILTDNVFSSNSIEIANATSIKRMLNPNISSMQNKNDIQASLFGFSVSDSSISNRAFGIKLSKSSFSLEAKKSTFRNDDSNKSKKLDANSIRASYSNGDNFSVSVGINSFEDDTNYIGRVEYRKAFDKHNITYALEYQNGIFVNGNTCLVDNDINVISVSLYDSILLNNLKTAESSLILNSFSDGNLNLNSWTKYPLYRKIQRSLESSISFVGNYEYNSKEDTCYGSTKFFDNSQMELKSKYSFASGGFLEAYGSIGYSFKNAKTIYSYGAILQIITSKSMDIYVDCKHYQSGYSPDGANECYASISRVW